MLFYWFLLLIATLLVRDLTGQATYTSVVNSVIPLVFALLSFGLMGKVIMARLAMQWEEGEATVKQAMTRWNGTKNLLKAAWFPYGIYALSQLGWGGLVQQLYPPEGLGSEAATATNTLMALVQESLAIELLLWLLPTVAFALMLDWLDYQWNGWWKQQIAEENSDFTQICRDCIESMWQSAKHGWLLMLAPVMALGLLVDAGNSLAPGWEEQPWSPLIWVALLLVLSVALPTLLGQLWGGSKIDDDPRARELIGTLQRAGINLNEIRIWSTQGRVVNAAVVGWARWGRRLLISDGLLEKLTPIELEMVVLHEAAHIQRKHAWWRMLPVLAGTLLLIPVALVTSRMPVEPTTGGLGERILGMGMTQLALLAAVPISSIILFGLCRIAHAAEYDADRWACKLAIQCSSRAAAGVPMTEQQAAQNLITALENLAGSREMSCRTTWFHPSVKSRTERLASSLKLLRS